jgi:hypothetical protein
VLSVVDRPAEPLVGPGIVRLVLEAAAQAARDLEFAALIRANDDQMRVGLVACGVEVGRLDPVPAPVDPGNWIFAAAVAGAGSFVPFRPRVAARCPRLVESVRAARPTTRGEGFGLVSQ